MPKKKNLSYYKNKAWRMFSKYIRTRDCIATTGTPDKGRCVTCGKCLSFKELQAGHAIGGRAPAILLDEQLVNAQCRGCNHFRDGNYGKYSVWFIEKYGLDMWEEKVKLSNTIVKYDKDYYKEKYNEYKDKLNELLK